MKNKKKNENELKKPNTTQLIMLLSIAVYFFTRDIILFVMMFAILFIMSDIYKSGYSVNRLKDYIQFRIKSLTPDN